MVGKKITSDEAMAKIRIMINNFNTREKDDYGSWGESMERELLIYKIEEVIKNTKMNSKKVLIEQLKHDEKVKKVTKKGVLGIGYKVTKKDNVSIIK